MPHLRVVCLFLAGIVAASAPLVFADPELPAAQPGRRLHQDLFDRDLSQWVIEQQPGGSVTVGAGVLTIADQGGCTVWFRPRLAVPVVITYTATVAAEPRVSDLNCFWMATDPTRPGDLFAPGHSRDGRFAAYDALRLYYVGYGGNDNSTTRFRRYAGDGTKPLLPEHDRQAPALRLQAGHLYRIMLIATVDGRVQFVRDGEVIFDYHDPRPLREGWFGFRTVHSRIEIRDFSVSAPAETVSTVSQ